MPAIEVKDLKNNVIETLTLSEERFSIKGKNALMHEAAVNYLANQRQGTHATKTKGLVSGGGKKPWKQKHTGRARSGSIRSPLWKGGGTIFGPLPRDYSYEMPKKARRTALFAALSSKVEKGEVTVLSALALEKPKTKDFAGILKGLGLDSEKSVLLLLSEWDEKVVLSARNLPNVCVASAGDLNVYDVLTHDRILATKSAMEALEKRPL
jgi:large subunit ribosomal protein L4